MSSKLKNQLINELRSVYDTAAQPGNHNKILGTHTRQEFARIIGISAPTLARAMDEPSRTTSETYRALQNYFQLEDNKWQFLPGCANSLDIIDTCREMKEEGDMAMIAAYTGSGKSSTLQQIAKSKNFPNTFYLECDIFFTSRKGFLKEVARAIGLPGWGSGKTILNRIVDHMKTLVNPLLIVDDFGKVSDSVFMSLQALQDKLVENRAICGLVIAGTEKLQQDIERKAARNICNFREIRRRIGYTIELGTPSHRDIRAITKTNFPELCEHPNELDWICEWGKKRDFGSLRKLLKTYRKALQNNTERLQKSEVTRMDILVSLKDTGAERI